MATQATLAALAKLTGLRDGVLARAARAEFADDPARFKQFSVTLDDLLFDFSKQRIDAAVLSALVELAKVAKVEAKREAMFAGEKINTTEKRAVLHTALRNFSGKPVLVDGKDVMPEVIGTREKMLSFAADVREGRVRGALGQPMTDVINIGIGGSDLGPAMATRALAPFAPPQLRSHFVSNVDGADIGDTLRGLDPSRTLFIVSSKTFTTQETMTNAATARAWIAQGVGEAAVGDHFAAVSTQLDKVAQFGIQSTRVFGFWDWVGGRYSVWSSIGLPLAIAIGPERFNEFLRGGYEIDEHFREAPIERNIPILMGLLSVWNRNVLGHATHGVIPYDQRLGRFPAYLQQLQMESNGKHVQLDGSPANTATGPVVWGEPGTNGQHAFFQLIHQGTEIIPLDLLVAATPTEADAHHHDLLVANCFAQGQALDARPHARGSRGADPQAGRERGRRGTACAAQELFRQPSDEHVPLSTASTRACSGGSSRSTSTRCSRKARSGTSTRSTSGASNWARSWPRAWRRSSPTPARARPRSIRRPLGWSRICARFAPARRRPSG